jgi:hypothetical protein
MGAITLSKRTSGIRAVANVAGVASGTAAEVAARVVEGGYWTYRKLVTLRPPADAEVTTETMLIYLTDAELLGVICGSADMRIILDDGVTSLPFSIESITRKLAVIAVRIPQGTVAGELLTAYIYAGRTVDETAYPVMDFGTALTVPPAKLDLSFTTGLAIDPTDQSVHPYALRVPADSWMASDGIGGTVTHIMADTPYPAGDDDYEATSLMYSTDGGATWAEWPGVTNPMEPSPAGAGIVYDPCMIITDDGALRVYYNYDSDGLVYRELTGTDLSNVTVGNRVVCTVAGSIASLVGISIVRRGGTWYLFGTTSSGANVGAWQRRTSTDGESWSDAEIVIPTWKLASRRWWHGAVTGPYRGGWYYLVASEFSLTDGPGTGANPLRLFRSRDLDTWQMSPQLLLTPTGGTWDLFYQACLYERTDGQIALIFSGKAAGPPITWFVGQVSPVPELSEMYNHSSDVFFGYGSDVLKPTAATMVCVYDFADGDAMADLSAASATVSLVNAPTHAAHVGYIFAKASKQRVVLPFSLASLGTQWAIEVDFTVPASLPGATNHFVACERTATKHAMQIYIYRDDTDKAGRLDFAYYDEDGAGKYTTQTMPDLRGGRHVVRMVNSSGAATTPRSLWVFVDGKQYYASSVTQNKVAMGTSTTLSLGGYAIDSDAVHGDVTIHAIRVWSSVPRIFTSAVPGGNCAPVVVPALGVEAL